MVEDFGPEAIGYVPDMIVLSPQLDDWGETSAEMTIALTEYFLENWNIDPNRVYLHGMSEAERRLHWCWACGRSCTRRVSSRVRSGTAT